LKVTRLIEKNRRCRELEAKHNISSAKTEGVVSKVMKDKNVLFNIIMMIVVWTSSSFTFYLFNFLIKYMPGDIYFNSIVSGFSAGALIIQAKLG